MFRSIRTIFTLDGGTGRRRLAAAPAQAQSPQQTLVNSSNTTLSNFLRDPDMSPGAGQHRPRKGSADRAVHARAGFIFGGSGGRAVLIARDQASGSAVGPAFYTMATAAWAFRPVCPCPKT